MKERKLLWDFMKDHTCLVEDLNIAANELGYGKHNALSCSLKRYAEELKQFDHYLTDEWHNPLNEDQMWILEYNEKEGQFHYNSSYKDGAFRQLPCSYGWMPITVLPDCYCADKEFTDLLDKISKKKLSFQDAAIAVYAWFSEKNAI